MSFQLVATALLIALAFALIFYLLKNFTKSAQKDAQEKMQQEFKALSLDVMQKSHESFLQLANQVFEKYQKSAEKDLDGKKQEIHTVLKPVRETLQKLDQQHRDIEKKREGAYVSLEKQIDQLMHSEKNLRSETANLVKALKSPNIRGSWGQIHLRRVVELAGMLNRCDFFEEPTERVEGRAFRPDLVVKLPGERQIIVDAKAPLEAYLDAIETENLDHKKEKLKDHANHVKRHVRSLSSKEYWKQFQPSPEYVILFLPAEAFFSAALEADPSILELGMGQNVIVATPTTLIAVLKAVALGWKQDSISKDAEKIAALGGELYERLHIMNEYFRKLGRSLTQSVDAYNQAISSLESRVLVSARKLKDSQMGKDLSFIEEIDKRAKEITKK